MEKEEMIKKIKNCINKIYKVINDFDFWSIETCTKELLKIEEILEEYEIGKRR